MLTSSQLNLERVNVQPFLAAASTMASADFSIELIEISPGKALIHKVYTGCIYTIMFIGLGLYKDVLAPPHYRASYAVSVRPYRLL
jgi:hypothetical protein